MSGRHIQYSPHRAHVIPPENRQKAEFHLSSYFNWLTLLSRQRKCRKLISIFLSSKKIRPFLVPLISYAWQPAILSSAVVLKRQGTSINSTLDVYGRFISRATCETWNNTNGKVISTCHHNYRRYSWRPVVLNDKNIYDGILDILL